jgi:L-malate glycosyltransferase
MKKLLYLGNALSQHGINVSTVETLTPLLQNEGYEVVVASSQKNKVFRFLDMLYVTLRYARKSDYVLIDTYSTLNFWYAVLVSQLCRLLRVKYIPILHGGNLPQRIQKQPFLASMVFKNSFCNVVPSAYLRTALETSDLPRIVSIPNTLSIENYTFLKRTSFEPNLLWVRAFDSIYNPEMAFQVLQNIITSYPQARLTMVGPFKGLSEEAMTQMVARYNLPVEIKGRLTKSEWISLSESYDFFINTTHFDNMPVSVMEAMALGLPVLSTRVGGLPYLISDGETGILVPDSDAVAMAKALEHCILNPDETQKMTQKARYQVEQLDWQIVKNQWKEVLK